MGNVCETSKHAQNHVNTLSESLYVMRDWQNGLKVLATRRVPGDRSSKDIPEGSGQEVRPNMG